MSIWRMAPLCLMWCIWREQNACSFEDCETGMYEIDLKKLRERNARDYLEKVGDTNLVYV
jgi:hypothetical protein